MNKFEFLQEEQNLEVTLELLSKEILNYIQKRGYYLVTTSYKTRDIQLIDTLL